MASQVLNQIEIELTQPFMLRDILPGPGWAPYQLQRRSLVVEIDHPSKKAEERGNCIKGLVVALTLEATVAFGAFGIWQLWHFIR